MHVFVTGASGFIGQATTAELIKHGHTVTGLARSSKSADLLTSQGIEVIHGDLENLEALKVGAKAADAVIHLGFVHDFTNLAKSQTVDRAAIQALAEGFEGENKILVISGGNLYLPRDVLNTEDAIPDKTVLHGRALAEDLLMNLTKEKGFLGAVARYSPSTHGRGDEGFVTMLGNLSKKAGYACYVGDGQNVWSGAHRLDTAVMLRLIIEKRHETSLPFYHAAAEEGVKMKDIMTAVGNRLGLPVYSKTVEEASESLGWFAQAISWNNPTSSEQTRKALGWTPEQIGLVEDIEKNYFL